MIGKVWRSSKNYCSKESGLFALKMRFSKINFFNFQIQVHKYLHIPLHGTRLNELNFDLTCQSSSLTPRGVYLSWPQGHWKKTHCHWSLMLTKQNQLCKALVLILLQVSIRLEINSFSLTCPLSWGSFLSPVCSRVEILFCGVLS